MINSGAGELTFALHLPAAERMCSIADSAVKQQ
jgi:hypothetical protein